MDRLSDGERGQFFGKCESMTMHGQPSRPFPALLEVEVLA
jgi:hypothetical protein